MSQDTLAPTPTSFRLTTEAPTPTSYRLTTEAPTPTTYRATTEAPTPTTYRATTEAPTPTTYRATTRAPTPSTYLLTTRAPTPSSFGTSRSPTSLPTSFPTTSYATTAMSAGQLAVVIVAIVALVGACLLYWFFSTKAAADVLTEGGITEDTPFFQESANNNNNQSLSMGNMDAALTSSTLKTVLAQGFDTTQYTNKGMKSIKLVLSGNELRWEVNSNYMSKKKYKLDLKDVLYVEWGKQTYNFRKASGQTAFEDQCFSLVSEDNTLDLEASSKQERDMLAQFFTDLIDGIKNKNDS